MWREKENELRSDYESHELMFLLMSHFTTAGICDAPQKNKYALCAKMEMIFVLAFPRMLNKIMGLKQMRLKLNPEAFRVAF